MIRTTYFDNYFNKRLLNGISIARYNIKWAGEKYTSLAPTFSILNWWKSLSLREQKLESNIKEYENRYYNEILSKLDPFKVYKELDGKILLCFEKPNAFCHRHIVSKWLNSFGLECKEL